MNSSSKSSRRNNQNRTIGCRRCFLGTIIHRIARGKLTNAKRKLFIAGIGQFRIELAGHIEFYIGAGRRFGPGCQYGAGAWLRIPGNTAFRPTVIGHIRCFGRTDICPYRFDITASLWQKPQLLAGYPLKSNLTKSSHVKSEEDNFSIKAGIGAVIGTRISTIAYISISRSRILIKGFGGCQIARCRQIARSIEGFNRVAVECVIR